MAESAARIEAVTRLQQRWGAGIIRRGVEVGDAGLRVAPVRATGVAAFDALLGAGGQITQHQGDTILATGPDGSGGRHRGRPRRSSGTTARRRGGVFQQIGEETTAVAG